jgi:hypothetical protein
MACFANICVNSKRNVHPAAAANTAAVWVSVAAFDKCNTIAISAIILSQRGDNNNDRDDEGDNEDNIIIVVLHFSV